MNLSTKHENSSMSSKGAEVLQPKLWRFPFCVMGYELKIWLSQDRIKCNIFQSRMHTGRATGYQTQATGKMQGGNSSRGGTKLLFTKRNQEVFLKQYWETSSMHFSNFNWFPQRSWEANTSILTIPLNKRGEQDRKVMALLQGQERSQHWLSDTSCRF